MTLEEILSLNQETLEIQNDCFNNPVTFQIILDKGYEKPNTIDPLTWEEVCDVFRKRRIQEDFDRFLKMNIRRYFPLYREMMRIDPTVTSYDWFIEKYNERYSELKEQGSTTRGGNESTSRTSSNTNAGSQTSSESTTSKQSNISSDAQRGISHGRQNPLSATYTQVDIRDYDNLTLSAGDTSKSSSIGHGIANPMITTPTASGDSLTMNDGVGETNGLSNGTAQVTDSRTINGTEIDAHTRNLTDALENDKVMGEIASGRGTKLSDLINDARACIASSDSFDYLYKKLNPCFMGAY